MAQKGLFGDDKIGALSESGGTITLQPSILTIGGQQFSESVLNVAANLTGQNTRYQIYAVRSGGVTSLVVSANENSSGPAGFTKWKLVGSYMTNGQSSVAFGSFLNIVGTPISEQILDELLFNSTDAANMNAHFNRASWYYRNGNVIQYHFSVRANQLPTATGSFGLAAPVNINFKATPLASGGAHGFGLGLVGINDAGATNSTGGVSLNGETQFLLQSNQTLSGGTLGTRIVTNSEFDWALGDSLSGSFSVPVANWSSTPIEDL
jgi:hypothetical protein